MFEFVGNDLTAGLGEIVVCLLRTGGAGPRFDPDRLGIALAGFPGRVGDDVACLLGQIGAEFVEIDQKAVALPSWANPGGPSAVQSISSAAHKSGIRVIDIEAEPSG